MAEKKLVRVLARLLRAGTEVFLLEIHHGPLMASGELEPVQRAVMAGDGHRRLPQLPGEVVRAARRPGA
jgi:hypothetical protein